MNINQFHSYTEGRHAGYQGGDYCCWNDRGGERGLAHHRAISSFVQPASSKMCWLIPEHRAQSNTLLRDALHAFTNAGVHVSHRAASGLDGQL